MARFEICTEAGTYTYDTDPCSLLDPDGQRVDLSRFKLDYVDEKLWENQIAFSPSAPVVGKKQPSVLKIQLGLGCNYSCSYCSQGGQKEASTSSRDAEDFDLDWVIGFPKKVEFWGGEPLLYWKKLTILSEKVDKRFGKIKKLVITNGTLLTREKIDWLKANGFTVAISHDGPGQSLRGDDPLEDPETRAIWRYAFDTLGENVFMLSVLTGISHDLLEIVRWFEARLGEVRVDIEDVVTDYGSAAMTEEQLQDMYRSVRGYVSSGLGLAFPRIRWTALHFMQTLAISKPYAGANQICAMDRKDHLAVDINGNVLTCQNAGAESGHKIGHISALDAVKLDTSTSYMNRPHCRECPVVHTCYGSCMFLKGTDFESSCRTSYWYNRAIFEGLIKLLTGKEVRNIQGWKPASIKRVIPLKVKP